MSLVDDLNPVWETGELKCGQCAKVVGFGRWQTIPENIPPGLVPPAAEKVHVKRPVVFCSMECLEAHEVRSKMNEAKLLEDWFAVNEADRTHPVDLIQTTPSGKKLVFKGTLKGTFK